MKESPWKDDVHEMDATARVVVSDFNQSRAIGSDGREVVLTRNTPGIASNALRVGDMVRCTRHAQAAAGAVRPSTGHTGDRTPEDVVARSNSTASQAALDASTMIAEPTNRDGVVLALESYELDPAPPLDFRHHRDQDYQSLLLHCAAVRLLLKQPALADQALTVLNHWDLSARAGSRPLHDRWREILGGKEWHRAVAADELGNQLRQASPLATLLPQETRLCILAHVRALKQNAPVRHSLRAESHE